MGISEMQRQFKAYGSGQLPELELRRAIRGALSEEPRLSQAVIDLSDAYRRADLIDANLHSTINSDIVEVTGPDLEMTIVRPRTVWGNGGQAANASDVNLPSGSITSPLLPATNNTGSTTDSGWDTSGQLNEISTPLYPGCVIRDRFVLVEELGRGGMGVVYKAYDRSRGDVKDRYVAIKVLNEDFKKHPLAVKSLQREARKAQRLAHPNIVCVHDFDRDCGNVFMVMEFLAGRSLEQVLREDGQSGIPLRPAMDIIRSLGAALSYAHQQDIVHCDFKPGNAFLNRDGKVKVLDFGIARAAPSLTEKGDATLFDAGQLGAVSPAYASLEMLQRATPDIRDDVYAFACVAYEILSGVHPYQRLDAAKAKQTGLKPRPIRRLSRTQWRALQQGLAFRRADRCPTIDSLVNQLATRPSRAKVWAAAAAACLGVAAIAGGLVWKWTEVRALAAHVHWPAWSSRQHQQSEPPTSEPTPGPAVDMTGRDLTDALSSPEPTAAWAAKVLPLIEQRSTGISPGDPLVLSARDTGVKVFVAAAMQARANRQFDAAAAFLTTARSFHERSPEVDFETVALDRDRFAAAPARPPIQPVDASGGDAQRYLHLAQMQFTAGKLEESLKTLADGRKKFARATELKDAQARYTAVADAYDHMSTAVSLNVESWKQNLSDLQAAEGEEYEAAAQMLAQTLADRIADQRAANREAVADKLLEQGKQIFPDYGNILGRGTAGVLPVTPIAVDEN
jgi:serine/threonine protein kinase